MIYFYIYQLGMSCAILNSKLQFSFTGETQTEILTDSGEKEFSSLLDNSDTPAAASSVSQIGELSLFSLKIVKCFISNFLNSFVCYLKF